MIKACEGSVDLLIHECFPPPEITAQVMGISVERMTVILNLAHTTPTATGKVFNLVKPRLAGLAFVVGSMIAMGLSLTMSQTVQSKKKWLFDL